MFIEKEDRSQRAFRLFRRTAWLAQAALWIFTILFAADYWLYELPATRNYYAAGLEQGFDSLAGIVAALDLTWQEARSVRGHRTLGRLNRLQGDTMFSVWLDQDEMPGWNAGLGSLKFDREGNLLWVRRYYNNVAPTAYAGDAVVKPRLDLRRAQMPQGEQQ